MSLAAAVIFLAMSGVTTGVASAAANRHKQVFTAHVILSGTTLHHTYLPVGKLQARTEILTDPDDITLLRNRIFVGFQNGVGPQGQPSPEGNTESTVVEFTTNGDPIAQWDVVGKTDGVTADRQANDVIATVNEDADSSLYTIDPGAPSGHQVTHYAYNEPLPHLGGTDAISIYHGKILISASAPGTTGTPAPQPTYPAVYSATLDPATTIATVTPLFLDEDAAKTANINSAGHGQLVDLALTDPDSNEVVPRRARFGGDFMLTSQGDQEQIFVRHAGTSEQRLSVLTLTQSVDDTAWPTTSAGTLYSTDSTQDSIVAITGPFVPYQPVVAATPCGANSAPGTCPAPPAYPANYLATLNSWTGVVTALPTVGAVYTPEGGLLFVP